jgi:hypothetical protein
MVPKKEVQVPTPHKEKPWPWLLLIKVASEHLSEIQNGVTCSNITSRYLGLVSLVDGACISFDELL